MISRVMVLPYMEQLTGCNRNLRSHLAEHEDKRSLILAEASKCDVNLKKYCAGRQHRKGGGENSVVLEDCSLPSLLSARRRKDSSRLETTVNWCIVQRATRVN
jgi:hypothetical protein